MNIQWNQVTWYSKLAATVVVLATFIIAFHLGILYAGVHSPVPAVIVTTTGTSGPLSLEARLGKSVQGRDISLTPLSVLEDSRCPNGVQCIWAGTVRIRATLVSGLGSTTEEFKLGQAVTTESEIVTLTSVSPEKTAGVSVKDSEYVFTFEVVKRASTGGTVGAHCGGFIKDAPTCARGFHCQLKVNVPDTGGTCVAD